MADPNISKRVLFVNGRAGAGKDTLADAVVEATGGRAVRVAFADPLRQATYEFNPLIEAGDLGFAKYRVLIDTMGYETAKRKYPAVRQALLDMADALRVTFGPNVFVERMMRYAHAALSANPRLLLVFSDFRMGDAEEEARLEHGIPLVFISHAGLNLTPVPHKTEQYAYDVAAGKRKADFTVVNDDHGADM